jgi:hypothetical protein
MLIFDAHLDMAWNACEWNRNLLKPVAEIRQFEKHFEDIVPGDCTVSWAELRRGRVGITICTLLPRLHRKHAELTFYQSREALKRSIVSGRLCVPLASSRRSAGRAATTSPRPAGNSPAVFSTAAA